ncbi:hypothetical protein MHBO_002363, partial [Bonamia ostreae]
IVKYSNKFKSKIKTFKSEIEFLVDSPNKNIASLAMNTLFKIGDKSSLSLLLETLSQRISNLPETMKLELLSTVTIACQKYPLKLNELVKIMSRILQNEPNFKPKQFIVTEFEKIIESDDKLREICLANLCDFIEDCEYSDLTLQILNIIGTNAVRSKTPSNYIRYVYNRITLELPLVRCAAVDALANIGKTVPALANYVKVLIQKCLNDSDDDVRDRAIINLAFFNIENDVNNNLKQFTSGFLDNLEYSAEIFLKENNKETFTMNNLKEKPKTKEDQKQKEIIENFEEKNDFAKIGDFGEKLKTTDFEKLTEIESEYFTECRKHIFGLKIVLEFRIKNEVENSILDKIKIFINENPKFFKINKFVQNENKIGFGDIATCFVVLDRKSEIFFAKTKCKMEFVTKQNGEEIEDEYILEDLNFKLKDFILPKKLNFGDFKTNWEKSKNCETIEKLVYLSRKDNLSKSVETLEETLKMATIQRVRKKDKEILNLMAKTCNLGTEENFKDLMVRAVLTNLVENSQQKVVLQV